MDKIREAIVDYTDFCFAKKKLYPSDEDIDNFKSTLLALTNLKPIDDVDLANFIISETGMDAPESDRLARKIVRFFGKVDNLRPLEEKEVESVIKDTLLKNLTTKDFIESYWESWIKIIAKAMTTHFSKPIVYPEKKEILKDILMATDELAYIYGYNQAISDMRKLNEGGI